MLRVLGYWKDSEYGDLRRDYCGERADAIYKISRAEEILWDDTIVLVQTPLHLSPTSYLFFLGWAPNLPGESRGNLVRLLRSREAEVHQKPCRNHCCWLGERQPCPVAAVLPSPLRWEGREAKGGEDGWTTSALCHSAKSLKVFIYLCRAPLCLGAGALEGETTRRR